eukprot:GEMP01000368.1.p1 GENE.GEMP01000368.1~~GEMP01000368.1.p1  ORF type:complete len:1906 (+),score=436.12 GEMP01000368.1:30-5720(+)
MAKPLVVVTTAVTAKFTITNQDPASNEESLVCEVFPPSYVPSAFRRRGITYNLVRSTDGAYVLRDLHPLTTYRCRLSIDGTEYNDVTFTTRPRLLGPQLTTHSSRATSLCVRWTEPPDAGALKYSLRYRFSESRIFETPWKTIPISRGKLAFISPRLLEVVRPSNPLRTYGLVDGGALMQTPISVISGRSMPSAAPRMRTLVQVDQDGGNASAEQDPLTTVESATKETPLEEGNSTEAHVVPPDDHDAASARHHDDASIITPTHEDRLSPPAVVHFDKDGETDAISNADASEAVLDTIEAPNADNKHEVSKHSTPDSPGGSLAPPFLKPRTCSRQSVTSSIGQRSCTTPSPTIFGGVVGGSIGTAYTIEGLLPRKVYQVQISTHDPDDDAPGPWSETLVSETWRPAPLIKDLAATAVTHNEVALTWANDATEQDIPVTEFIIDIHGAAPDKRDWHITQSSSEARQEAEKRGFRPNLFCCVVDIHADSSYVIKCHAVTSAGKSEEPATVEVTSMSLAPAVNSLTVASVLHNAVQLTWRYPQNIDAIDYRLSSATEQLIQKVRFRIGRTVGGMFSSREWSELDGLVKEDNTDEDNESCNDGSLVASGGAKVDAEKSREQREKSFPTTYTLGDLQPETDYLFQVRVFTKVGESDWSNATPETRTKSVAPKLDTTVTIAQPKRRALLVQWEASSAPEVVAYMLRYKNSKVPVWSEPIVVLATQDNTNTHGRRSAENPQAAEPSSPITRRSSETQSIRSGTEGQPILHHLLQGLASSDSRPHVMATGLVENLEPDTNYDLAVAAKSPYGIGSYTKSSLLCTLPVAPDVIKLSLEEVRPTALRVRLTMSGVHDDVASARVRIAPDDAGVGFFKSFISADRQGVWDEREVNVITMGGAQLCEITELTAVTKYVVQACAVTPAGCGFWSMQERFSTWRACFNVKQPTVLWNSYNQCRLMLQEDTYVDDLSIDYRDDPIIGFEVWHRSKQGTERTHRFETDCDMRANIYELDPSTEYHFKSRSISNSGVGEWSPPCTLITLPVAPSVHDVKMFCAKADSLDITWKTDILLAVIPGEGMEEPGSESQLSPDLEVIGFDVRWAEEANVFKNRVFCEPVRVDRDLDQDTSYRIENLKDATVYVVEVRSVTLAGVSPWSAEQLFQTTVPTAPPTPPVMIMSTATQLTIAFEAEGDEFELFQLQMDDGQSREPYTIPRETVRRNLDRRVVTLENLKPDTTRRIRVRGVTNKNTPSSWSEWSAPMKTRVGVIEHKLTSGDWVLDTGDSGIAQSSSSTLRFEEESLGKKLQDMIEPSLKFLLKVALGGVEFPQGGNFPSVKEQAQILMLTYGNVEAAIDFCVNEAESRGDETLHILSGNVADFIIGCIPIAGFPAVFIKELSSKLRRIALIAELSGHDTEDIEVLSLMFTCLVPQIGGNAAVTEETSNVGAVDTNALIRGVSRAVVAEALILAAGVPSLRNVVMKGMDILLSRETEDTPPGSSVEFLAREVFRATPPNEEVWFLVVCAAAWALPFVLSALNFFAQKILPFFLRTISQEISLYAIFFALFVGWITAAPLILKYQNTFKLCTHPDGLVELLKVPAPIIFVAHAVLPCLSCYLGMREIAIAFSGEDTDRVMIVRGVYSLLLNYVRWCVELRGKAQLDETQVPAFGAFHVQAKHCAELLWKFSLFFFFVEEFLGRFIGLHSVRLISGSSSMFNFKSIHFALSLIGARAQAHLLDSFQKRQVLLRILGAKRTVIGSMVILLTGVFAMVKYRETGHFLARISPNSTLCCAIVIIRRWGLIVGILLPAIWLVFHILPMHVDFIFTLFSGCALGTAVTTMSILDWQASQSGYMSNYRVVLLFPETSAKVRETCQKLVLTGTDMTVRRGAIIGSQHVVRRLWGFAVSRLRR